MRQELSAAERGMKEAEFLDRAKQALSDAQQRCQLRYAPEIRERARELAGLPSASSPDWLAGAQMRAHDTADSRQREQLGAEQRKSDAACHLTAGHQTSP